VAPVRRRDPEHGGKPDCPFARLLARAVTITRAQHVVQVVQGPAAAGAAKVLANAVHKAGGCFRVPHQARRTVCARRSDSRGARAAGERETGLSGAGPSWAGAGLGLGWRASSGSARAGLGLNRVFQFDSALGKGLEHYQVAPAAGHMTGQPEAHGLGWDQCFLSGEIRRRPDATGRGQTRRARAPLGPNSWPPTRPEPEPREPWLIGGCAEIKTQEIELN
jgi:hypothetical protein